MISLTEKYGKGICVALYAVFAYYAAKDKPIPLFVLAAMHLTEYVTVARKVGRDFGKGALETFVNCLAFGFTWWLPIKNG